MKKFLALLLCVALLISFVPQGVFASEINSVSDAAVFFSDLHSSKSDSKTSTTQNIMKSVASSGLNITSVTSVGDVFSSNSTNNFGSLDTITSDIKTGIGNQDVSVFYAWSDHDRNTAIADYTGLLYGAGSDGVYGNSDDANYYIYTISMSDTSTNDRYNTGVFGLEQATLDKFTSDVAMLDHTKPLFIASHQPLLDRRDDNGNAYAWCQVINEAAETMDIVFLFGHNHKYDKAEDYFYSKGDTMSVCSSSSGSAKSVVLNFTHMCAGYLAPSSTGSTSSSTRQGTVVLAEITADDIIIKTYDKNGAYTGSYAVNETISRDFAAGGTTEPDTPVEPEVPEEPETPVEPDVPEEPETPEVNKTGKVWRQTTTIENGKKYMFVNYGYNDSGVGTYAVNSSAAAVSVEVETDDNGAYIISDDNSLVWNAKSNSSQFEMQNEDNGYYLRSANYVYGSSGSNISVDSSTKSGSTYTNWSMETKSGRTVLAVRRAGSSNYYPVLLNTSSNVFQSYNSSTITSKSNWLTVFVETDETLGCEHNYTSSVVNATCEKDGLITYTCSLCGESYSEVIKATGHSYTSVKNDATCAKEGKITYTCSCGDTYEEVIPATGKHTYTSVKVDATCENEGSITYTCSVCAVSYVETINAIGHSYNKVITAPDCVNGGYTTYTCLNCGESYKADYTEALGHSYKENVIEATCSENGLITYTCDCGASYEEIIPATGIHEYETVKVEADCENDGYVKYTCSCGDTYKEVIKAVGHSYDASVTAPDCVNGGYTTYTCLNCGDSYTDSYTEAKGHTYTESVTAPTCENEGYTTYKCACGDTYVANETPALGHSFEAKVTAPTCTAEGYTAYTCKVCGYTYKADYVSATGHTYGTIVKDPTCTEGGYTLYFCSCGDSYEADETPALGHSYNAEVTAPTCTAEGYTTYTCLVCEHSYVGDKVAALGHNYTSVETDEAIIYTCENCGHSYEEEIANNFTYNKVSSFTSGESYVITLYSNKKYYAITHENNNLGVTQVTVSNNKVTSDITEDMLWDYNSSKLSYVEDGTTYYLNMKSSGYWWSSSYTFELSSTNSSTVTLSKNKIKVGSRYLKYSNGSVTTSSSGTTAYIYQETEE